MVSSQQTSIETEAFDVLIVGAGLSGINCAYRLETELPGFKFAVLEGRDRMGGTWDVYRYPGVRSDSDVYSMGFTWHPWSFYHPIGTGDEIMEYITDAVSKHHLDRYIRFSHKVLSANWSTADQNWTLVVKDHDGISKHFRARWIILGTGYFDYDTAAQPDIPGLDSFRGKIISPQFWPQDFDYSSKKIALIGSGATAIGMLPALPDRVAQVTMIQRSPTYIFPWPNVGWLQKYLPRAFVDTYRLVWYMFADWLTLLFCQYFPGVTKDAFRNDTIKLAPISIDYDTHLKPSYNPWDQRICTDPDGVFHKALHRPNVHLVTGEIEKVTGNGIQMRDGQSVDADIIITATGFRMMMGGKIQLQVDGKPISWGKRYIWNGAMLDGVPNMMFALGYTFHAWTAGANHTAAVFIRLWKFMEQNALKIATPKIPRDAAAGTQRMWGLDATYVRAAEDRLPVYGMKGNWKPRTRPPIDYVHARWGDCKSGLEFST